MKNIPGTPYPLGATWDGGGVNFALFSENATGAELCLFEVNGVQKETHRIRLTERTDHVWHTYLPEARPGWLYGYRVYGPYEPVKGHRFNPHKIVIDPYAKMIVRKVEWNDAMFPYPVGNPSEDLVMDRQDNAPYAPLAAVIDPAFNWGDDHRLKIPWHETVIYETHVKGMTMLHPDVPEELRGTYAGLASEPVIEYLTHLGITAVELLPIHHHVDEYAVVKRGLVNYWGYNSLSYFAPDIRYHANTLDQVHEFKRMVRSFHAAGIEVILDVVYNHTAEGGHLGPILSFRGIDNAAYYRLDLENQRYYTDYTGCGNTLNMQHPHVLQLVMDSLRYWITEMHVDGFRFDLASTLARELHDVDRLGAFFDIIHQDPTISQVKLIAEPWDLGEGGYQVGNFPVLWTEWNGIFRDSVRRFWKGDGGLVNELATRLAGSSDLYEQDGRRPHASINFITAHDGFTLHDLVSYNEKNNEANGEDNRDGTDDNNSWNCGTEGPTDDHEIILLREQQKRNLMATLILSHGVAMICGGDEMGRTQQGNNNAYCQDNPLTWQNWSLDKNARQFLEFTREVIRIWKNNPVLRRKTFFQGRRIRGSGIKDIAWFSPSGREMTDEEWNDPHVRSLGIRLAGDAMEELDEKGNHITGETLLILMNSHHENVSFILPENHRPTRWVEILDTSFEVPPGLQATLRGGETFTLKGRSMAVFVNRHGR